MDQQKAWQVKRIATIVVFSVIAVAVLFLALFFSIRAYYYVGGARGGGRYVIFTDNFNREYRVDLPKGENRVEQAVELDYDIDTYYTFTYKVYYSESGKFTGEQGGYGYRNPYGTNYYIHHPGGEVEYAPNYGYTVYGGGEGFGDDNLVKAYAEYYGANGKVSSVSEIGLRVNLKDAKPIPKLIVWIEKPGKYEDFLWKDHTAADYRLNLGNGSYQVTVPEGWVFDVREWDEDGNYIGEEAGRTHRFYFDKDEHAQWIWIYREDPENTERRFWVEVTETFNQDADYVPEAVTAPYSTAMHVTKYNIEQLTFTPTSSGIYEMKMDNESVEYLVTDGDMSSGEYKILETVAHKCDVEYRYLENGKTYNIYFLTKQKDAEINFSLKSGDVLTVGSDYSKNISGHCILTFVPPEDGDYIFEIDTDEIEYFRYTTETDYINRRNYIDWTHPTDKIENLKAGVPCYIFVETPIGFTCRIVKA